LEVDSFVAAVAAPVGCEMGMSFVEAADAPVGCEMGMSFVETAGAGGEMEGTVGATASKGATPAEGRAEGETEGRTGGATAGATASMGGMVEKTSGSGSRRMETGGTCAAGRLARPREPDLR